MQGIAMLLFVLGVLFIYWGLKEQDKPSREVIAALKGLAKVKKDLYQVNYDVETLTQNVDRSQKFNSEIREDVDALKAEFQVMQNTFEQYQMHNTALAASEVIPDNSGLSVKAKDENTNVYSLDWIREHGAKSKESLRGNHPRDVNTQIKPLMVSDKYAKVIELTQAGKSIIQVAEELAMSQDAVNMVLRTYKIGGQR